jgi:sugar O-acyltransferase (sialic acid O-acetyltransferase NeuD family)
MLMDNPVIIFGATALGRQARMIFEENGNAVYGFLDDDKEKHGKEIDGVSILGAMDDDGFLKFIGRKCEAFVAVDDSPLRKSLVKMLHEKRHVQPVNCIQKTAVVPDVASIGHGNLIDMGVMIGAGASLGSHCVVQAGAVVAAQASLGDFVQVGSGALINSDVTIADEVFIGSGAVIVAGITIGKGARIGAGSVVIQPVAAGETVFGNPAEVVKV